MAQITIQIVVTKKERDEIERLAKSQKRSVSNMASYLLALGKLKFYEQDVAATKLRAKGEAA